MVLVVGRLTHNLLIGETQMTTLTATAFNDLTAIITGKPAGRVANREAAEARFRREAAKAAIDADFILAHGNSYDCAKALNGDLEALKQRRAAEEAAEAEAIKAAEAARDARVMAAAATMTSPGLSRLRAHPKAEEIRTQTVAEAEAVKTGTDPFAKPGRRKAALALVEAAAPAPVEKPKKERAAKPKAEKAEADRSRAKIEADGKITAVVENPKKPGSRAHACFAVYRAGQTVSDFIAACAEAGIPEKEAKANIAWDRRKGFITVEAGA